VSIIDNFDFLKFYRAQLLKIIIVRFSFFVIVSLNISKNYYKFILLIDLV